MRSTRGRRACAPGARTWAGMQDRFREGYSVTTGGRDTLHIQYSPDPFASVIFKMYSCMSLVSSSLKLANRLAEYYE